MQSTSNPRSRSASRSLTPRSSHGACSVPHFTGAAAWQPTDDEEPQQNNMLTDESNESTSFPVQSVVPRRRNTPPAVPASFAVVGSPLPWPQSPGSSISDYSTVTNNSQTALVAAAVPLMPIFPNLQKLRLVQPESVCPAAAVAAAESRAVAAEDRSVVFGQQAFLAVQQSRSVAVECVAASQQDANRRVNEANFNSQAYYEAAQSAHLRANAAHAQLQNFACAAQNDVNAQVQAVTDQLRAEAIAHVDTVTAQAVHAVQTSEAAATASAAAAAEIAAQASVAIIAVQQETQSVVAAGARAFYEPQMATAQAAAGEASRESQELKGMLSELSNNLNRTIADQNNLIMQLQQQVAANTVNVQAAANAQLAFPRAGPLILGPRLISSNNQCDNDLPLEIGVNRPQHFCLNPTELPSSSSASPSASPSVVVRQSDMSSSPAEQTDRRGMVTAMDGPSQNSNSTYTSTFTFHSTPDDEPRSSKSKTKGSKSDPLVSPSASRKTKKAARTADPTVTASPAATQCPMCGCVLCEWYPPWNSWCCSQCQYPTASPPPAPTSGTSKSKGASACTPPRTSHTTASSQQQGPEGGIPTPKSNPVGTHFHIGSNVGDSSDQSDETDTDSSSDSFPSDESSSDGDEPSGGGGGGRGPPGGPPSPQPSDDDNPNQGDGGGRGQPGGPPHPPPPGDDGLGELLGGFGDDSRMDWSFNDAEVYKDKDILSVKCPTIPSDSSGARAFWNSLKTELSAIDRSEEDWLTQWIDVPRTLLGSLKDVKNKFDLNSQGLIRLDRYLAKLLAEKGKDHPIFAMKFATYTEHCHNHNKSPKGRVMLAIIAQRFRLDRFRNKSINLLHLYKVELASFKFNDVQDFLNRVRYVLGSLGPEDVMDKKPMFEWLFEKFKSWSAIASEVRKIRKSKDTSRRRRWSYLWNAIHNYIDHYHEDANFTALKKAIEGDSDKKVKGGAAPKKEPKTPKVKADPGAAAWQPTGDAVPGALLREKAKGIRARGRVKIREKVNLLTLLRKQQQLPLSLIETKHRTPPLRNVPWSRESS